MSLIGQEILIIGGGIAGLAAARALALRGAQVEVLEQAEAIREVGAGIQMSPNGHAVLRALGLEAGFAEIATPSRGVRMRDGIGGREVMFLDLARRGGHFSYVHRADFIALLEAAAREVGVRIGLGQRVAAVDPGAAEGAAAVVTMADGSTRRAGLVLGADGLHSVARAALMGPEQAEFTGQVAWRALVPLEAGARVAPEAQLYLGAGRHVVAYPLRGGQVMNIVACEEVTEWAEEGWQIAGDLAAFRQAFADFPPPLAGWLARVETVRRWGLFKHPVATRWQAGRLAILGDAAHPTLPYLAQGAVMGLEDGWVLAEALAGHDSLEAALLAYQAARHKRCERIVAAAGANAGHYHLPPGPRRIAAHTALRLAGRLTPGLLPGRFDWLWGHDVTAPAG